MSVLFASTQPPARATRSRGSAMDCVERASLQQPQPPQAFAHRDGAMLMRVLVTTFLV